MIWGITCIFLCPDGGLTTIFLAVILGIEIANCCIFLIDVTFNQWGWTQFSAKVPEVDKTKGV
jgi:hypothetical protein